MAKNKNPLIHARQVTPGAITTGDLPNKTQMDYEFLGLSSKIAESTICNRNWPWKNARIHFIDQPLLRTVDKYYPQAKGGPLYIDEPLTKEEEKLCEIKRPKMLQEKLRYIVINKEASEHEVRSQLKGIDGLAK